ANVSEPITCITNSVTLIANNCNPVSGISYSWDGPGSFSSAQQCPTTITTGTYTVTATNGCPSTTTTEVISDLVIPDVQATGGELTCTATSVQVSSVSTTPGVSYSWTGPNGFSS